MLDFLPYAGADAEHEVGGIMIPAIIITFLVGVGTLIGAWAAATYRDIRYDGMLSSWYRREHGYGAGDMKIYALLNGLSAGGYLMGTLEIIASVVLLIAAVVKM